VSHLVASVLSESDCLRPDTNTCEEEVRSSEEVTQSFALQSAFLDRLSDCELQACGLDAVLLVLCREKWQLHVSDRVKLGVRGILRVIEVLNLAHGELTDTQEALSWRNLVSETSSDLCSGEGHPSIIVLDESAEVDKDTLGSLWPQESTHVARWSNLVLEHKVEWLRIRKSILRLGVLDLQLRDALVDLLSIVVLAVHDDLFKHLLFLWLLALSNSLLQHLFNEFIGASRLVGLDIAHHEVRELLDVA